MIRFGIIRFGLVNDTEASVFGYSVFTRFVRPLILVKLNLEAKAVSKMHEIIFTFTKFISSCIFRFKFSF